MSLSILTITHFHFNHANIHLRFIYVTQNEVISSNARVLLQVQNLQDRLSPNSPRAMQPNHLEEVVDHRGNAEELVSIDLYAGMSLNELIVMCLHLCRNSAREPYRVSLTDFWSTELCIMNFAIVAPSQKPSARSSQSYIPYGTSDG